MRRELGRLADTGATLVRWWLLGDGRAGLRESHGRVLGVDERLLDDVQAAADALREARLRAIFVLTDFLWFHPRRVEGGVRLFGRRHLVREPALRAQLMERVFGPIAETFAAEPAIAGWDLMNEPEWATLAVGTLDPRRSVARREMRSFLRELAELVRGRARQPVTVGLASARWLALLDGVPLDFLQVHWYESLDSHASLARPVSTRDLGRPLLLGEFPTRGCSLPPERILDIAAAAGYSGALAWSLLATDHATDGGACATALARVVGHDRGNGARLRLPMPVYRLDDRLVFPPAERGPRWGPIAVGGDLRPERLLLAYSMGIFPWQGDPLHWHSPDPRMVLLVDELRVTQSLAKTLRQGRFRLTLDRAFADVMVACASVPGPGQDGTWITPRDGRLLRRAAPARASRTPSRRGKASELVGGLYGLSLGGGVLRRVDVRPRPDASKVGLRRARAPARALEHPARGLPGLHARTSRASARREWPRREFLAALALGPREADAGGAVALRRRPRAADATSSTTSRPRGPRGTGRSPAEGDSR